MWGDGNVKVGVHIVLVHFEVCSKTITAGKRIKPALQDFCDQMRLQKCILPTTALNIKSNFKVLMYLMF